jgi:hypothetical protein
MSWASPADEGQGNPALIKAMLHRRKSTPILYWRFKRPKARVYAAAVARLVAYRLGAAVPAVLSMTALAFIGAAAGIISSPRWPPLKSVSGEMINAATVHATAEIAHLAPAIVALSIALVIMPRPHRWLFTIITLGIGFLGYYQRYIPPFPQSTIASAITQRAASLISRIPLPTSGTSISVAIVPLVLIALIIYFSDRLYHATISRSASTIPRRPASHYRSTFRSVTAARRLSAASVAAVFLSIDLWIVVNLRAQPPVSRYAIPAHGHSPLSAAGWLLAVVAVAFLVCAPRPQGYRPLMILLVIGLTACAFLPYRLLAAPAGIPAAPHSFWPLIIAYLLITGFAFDLVAALLDWPV